MTRKQCALICACIIGAARYAFGGHVDLKDLYEMATEFYNWLGVLVGDGHKAATEPTNEVKGD